MILNAAECLSFDSSFFLDADDESSSLIGAESFARFAINFIK